MAKYDRKLLIPYLETVYCAELLLLKVQRDYKSASDNKLTYQLRLEADNPPEPPKNQSGEWKVLLPIGILLGFIALTMLFSGNAIKILLSFVVGFIAFFFLLGAYTDLEYKSWYEEGYRKYTDQLRAYNSRKSERESNRRMMDSWDQQMVLREKRVREVRKLRDRVYSVNVIPLPYRNVYAAHFLYEFFRSGQADDLEQVIAIFVLEEIKARLDRVIDQQMEMILNQRAIIANQERIDSRIAENHKREMNQIAMLNENAQQSNKYLEMINANLELNNYFAYNNYIRIR